MAVFLAKLTKLFTWNREDIDEQVNQVNVTETNEKEYQLISKSMSPMCFQVERNNSTLKEALDNPLKALETNEKLRNAVAAKGKQMGWNILPTNNVTSNKIAAHNCDSKVTNTDLGEIKLNEKIKVHQSGSTTDTINILMFGKSGCGQTTLLSYLTDNNQLIGTDSMSTQQFSAETFQLPNDTGMTNIRINESPGMCSGLEIQQLQEHWNHLISRVNKEGGVSVFLLLIKSNERIPSQFIDELEEFSELYFDEREELWKRTAVVFTSIDELKGCNTLEDRINKLETQIAKPGMEKVKNVIDQTSAQCIYVSSLDHSDKQRVVNDLSEMLRSIEPREQRICKPQNLLNEIIAVFSGEYFGEEKAVDTETKFQDIPDFIESNTHQLSVTYPPNDYTMNSKPAHVLTNEHNNMRNQEFHPSDSLFHSKSLTRHTNRRDEIPKFIPESSQRSSVNIAPNKTHNQEQNDNLFDKRCSNHPHLSKHSNYTRKNTSKQNVPPCTTRHFNSSTTQDKLYTSGYPDKDNHSPLSNDTRSTITNYNICEYPSSSNSNKQLQVSRNEFELKEIRPNTYGAKDNPIDTENTATTSYTKNMHCEQFNVEWLNRLDNNDPAVFQQFTNDNLLELVMKAYQEKGGKKCIISAYEKLMHDKRAQCREKEIQGTFV